MIESSIIVGRESENDGRTVYMYFNNEVGFYTAYGFSAFYLCHVIDPIMAFSTALDLPVVLVNNSQVLELRHSLKKIEHIKHCFYHFETKNEIGYEGYDKWLRTINQQ